MKSKTLIEEQLKKKENPNLVETIIVSKKNKNWLEIAQILSSPRKNKISINLEMIDKEAKTGETIVVPGKVLSQGELNKKIKLIAFDFSEKAKEKVLKSDSEILTILEEIKKNPEAKNVKILK
ncbi:MAG: 50S ribosomal protein L18e [Candidatus Pacearchaeota archaeon]|nr:50S ribosomal protein L18e [Candidatus Pacearchaeota archaeon]